MRFYHLVLLHSLLIVANCIEYCPSGTLIIVRGLKPDDQNAATCAHNKVRQSLLDGKVLGQPQAKFMKEMVYDQWLAHKASPVSKQCANTPIDVRDRRWPCVAQMTYLVCSGHFSPNQYWDEAVNFWLTDKTYFRQLAWADMDTFGCDYALFLDSGDPNKPFCKMYTCNYGLCANSPLTSDSAPYETL